MSYTYQYPRPALTVDGVIFGLDHDELKVLLIQRRAAPYQNSWALPGGFMDMDDEDCDAAIARELEEETSLEGLFVEQLYTFSKKGRDPRERVVTVAYYGLVRPDALHPEAGSDAKAVDWFAVGALPPLAFDHPEIIEKGLARLRGKIRYEPIAFALLPEAFTLAQLQHLYETVLGHELDKRNFRKKVLATGVLAETDFVETGAHRPARLYRFDDKAYRRLLAEGGSFAV